ncbi:NADH dehydrogenase 1 alpha subcomplex subunit 9 [Sarcoptes scabiei]|nr:hypothetical protein QR98_0091310 [Sarcoptes scabiei]UXI19626.1 NADH dehydrogenase 1 alpha subcomplex subunit 9 [Sarcoptes scabiei]
MEGTMSGRLAPINPAGLSHAVVVDSESDLMGAESDSKFSFSKLKKPFSRLPLDLRFNNRFINGPILSSASNILPQIHQQSHPPLRPQMMRQTQPNPIQRPFQGPMMHLNQPPRNQFQAFSIAPPGFNGHQPIYKSIALPPQISTVPKSVIQAPQTSSIQLISHPHNGPDGHVDMESPIASNGDQLVHTITEYIDEDDRLNELRSDFDRQAITAPSNDIWPVAQPDLPKIVHLDVKCEKNFMKISVEFDRPFNGIIFSKGHFSQPNCIHLPAGSGRSQIYFDIRIDSCGTTGNMGPNSLSAFGNVNVGNFFENIVIFQYDPFVQEAWDQARKLRCTWHDQYEKSVSFRPFPVDMVDVVRADFAGDNVGCWMQIQVGRGPWASEVAGIVKIGQTMTMVLAIKDEENKFDMLVRNCVAHDGKRAPIELVDTNGCIVRNKLMSRFTKIKNFGSSASVLSYAHFQAFKFPDSMEVHFQCTIQICKNSCPEQCDQTGQSNIHYINHQISGTINTHSPIGSHQTLSGDTIYINGDMEDPTRRSDNGVLARPREVRDVNAQLKENSTAASKEIGLNKVIRVVSTGDLNFGTSDKLTANETSNEENTAEQLSQSRSWLAERMNDKICMSSLNFVVCFITLSTLALIFFTCSIVMCCRRRTASLDSAAAAAAILHGHSLGGKHSQKSAKEVSLINGKNNSKRNLKQNDYNNGQTIIPVGMSATANTNYLGSSSMLSPRVQAGANGYSMYH